jgi:drug/metabolite transporter (DMT)-like permease
VDVDWSSFPTSIWLAIAYVLLFTTFFAYLFNAYALKIVSPTVAGIYVYLQPLLTTMVALWTGKDELTMIKVLAGMLIFFGVFLVTQKPK